MSDLDSAPSGLSIFGVGGHARECAWIAEAAGWRVDCFIDRTSAAAPGQKQPIHAEAAFLQAAREPFHGVIGIGDPQLRRKIAERVQAQLPGLCHWATLRHPTAVIAPSARLGQGSVVFPQACISVDVQIGAHAIVNLGATVSHDVAMGDCATIGPGAHIAGGVRMGRDVVIGVGAVIRNSQPGKLMQIGDGAVVGAGAVVVSAVQAGAVVVGAPARPIA